MSKRTLELTEDELKAVEKLVGEHLRGKDLGMFGSSDDRRLHSILSRVRTAQAELQRQAPATHI